MKQGPSLRDTQIQVLATGFFHRSVSSLSKVSVKTHHEPSYGFPQGGVPLGASPASSRSLALFSRAHSVPQQVGSLSLLVG